MRKKKEIFCEVCGAPLEAGLNPSDYEYYECSYCEATEDCHNKSYHAEEDCDDKY
jgi:hypothetical protein